jgi:hypothetical protein
MSSIKDTNDLRLRQLIGVEPWQPLPPADLPPASEWPGEGEAEGEVGQMIRPEMLVHSQYIPEKDFDKNPEERYVLPILLHATHPAHATTAISLPVMK